MSWDVSRSGVSVNLWWLMLIPWWWNPWVVEVVVHIKMLGHPSRKVLEVWVVSSLDLNQMLTMYCIVLIARNQVKNVNIPIVKPFRIKIHLWHPNQTMNLRNQLPWLTLLTLPNNISAQRGNEPWRLTTPLSHRGDLTLRISTPAALNVMTTPQSSGVKCDIYVKRRLSS